MSKTIRVALVDDQALFRAGIRMVVDSQSDLAVVGEAGNGAEAITLVAAEQPDVVLMDIRMPVLDGIEATRAILATDVSTGSTSASTRVSKSASKRSSKAAATAPQAKAPRIIVLTTFDLDEAAARAIRAGASGFVLKDADPEFLLAAIRTVHAGNAVIAAGAMQELFEHFGRDTAGVPDEYANLTVREREIFDLAARGLSNAEIASREFVSEATVKTHVSRILTKLALRDRVQLVVYAFEHGLRD